MDHVRPVPDGAPQGAPSGGDAAKGDAARLADLLRQAALGDEGAFADFYDATSARAYGLALRVVRNPAHAEEVTQEAYLDAWRSSTRYDAERGSAVGLALSDIGRSTATLTSRSANWTCQPS